jgi:hypothetical protein
MRPLRKKAAAAASAAAAALRITIGDFVRSFADDRRASERDGFREGMTSEKPSLQDAFQMFKLTMHWRSTDEYML